MEDLNFLQSSMDGNKTLFSSDTEDTLTTQYGKLPVIVVEDDPMLGMSIKAYLSKTLGCEVKWFTSSLDCLTELLSYPYKDLKFCLVTDISLEQGADGLLLIDNLKDKGFNFVSIAMTGFASIETAIAATKKGVFHYLTKPFELKNLSELILEAVEKKFSVSLTPHRARVQVTNSKSSRSSVQIEYPSDEDIFSSMIGRSPQMKEVFSKIEKVAATDSTVLIQGPSGTGKELVAAAIHSLSLRRNSHMVSVNCGAIPQELLESELFGHSKGSFTGALSDRKGKFELATRGSIFLDEIGDMPLLLQVKILRALQNQTIEPVGSNKVVSVDTRVIAATHRDLEKMVDEQRFREDLFYRLNVIPIRVPPLKERKEDIPLLMAYFLKRFTSANSSNAIDFSPKALKMLIDYDWPGNVRELENIIERLVILRGGNEILPEDLPAKIFRHNPVANNHYKDMLDLPTEGVDLKKVLSDIEDSLITQALKFTNGNKNQASKLLSLNRTTLIEKLKKKSLNY